MQATVNAITPMMLCGHSANATDASGNPCCVICFGDTDGKDKQVDPSPPSLEGRTARCAYWRGGCRSTFASSSELAFFQAGTGENPDEYYCGCHGWD